MWNKLTAFMIIVIASSQLLVFLDLEARGGRGGSGRGGGGGRGASSYHGGQTMNRTPTMSRSVNRPNVSQMRQQGQNRQINPQQKTQQIRQKAQQRPTATNRPELRNQVNNYAQKNSPKKTMDPQALQQKAQKLSSNRKNQISQNRQLSNTMSQRLQQMRPNYNHWFDQNFFNRHNINNAYISTRTNWWRPAAWATLVAWGSWGWSTPYYYDEGYVYPMTDYSTIVSEQTAPAQSTEASMAADGEWLPLGVFALANSSNAAILPNRFIQLAINRSGEIAGVLYNSSTDSAQDIIGVIDKTTQMAYWSLADRVNSPIASTGLYNLTEDQTTINVHFSDGSDQTWTLVRLQQ